MALLERKTGERLDMIDLICYPATGSTDVAVHGTNLIFNRVRKLAKSRRPYNLVVNTARPPVNRRFSTPPKFGGLL